MTSRARRQAGFTLLEIMTVIAILAILMSILIYGIGKYRITAYEKGTEGLLESIRAALESYHADYSEYPPDGFDPANPAIRMSGGQKAAIHGSACLVYYLGIAQIMETEVGQDVRKSLKPPYLEFKTGQLSGGDDRDLDQKLADPRTEVVDAWGNPIHYDRLDYDTQTGRPKIDDQSSPGVHTMQGFVADKMHGPDPRKKGGKLETKNAGSYDLFSHGTDPLDPTRVIGNWKD